MDKLLNILSEQPTYNISPEIELTEILSNKVSEAMQIYQESSDEVQQKSLEIENLKEKEQSLFASIKHREKQFDFSMETMEDLQREYECLAKIDESDQPTWSEKEILNKLEKQMKLFGLDIQAVFLQPTVYQAKISFAEDKYVVINCDIISNSYDLQDMQPTHRNCGQMRTFLLETRDIVGFLYHVRKFFAHKM